MIGTLAGLKAKIAAKGTKWLIVAGVLLASHGWMYHIGGVNKEKAISAANIEQVQKDAVNNAEAIESQITRLNEATERLRRQANKVEGAINDNQEVNLNPSCSTSDDELREFNQAIGQANRGLPDGGSD